MAFIFVHHLTIALLIVSKFLHNKFDGFTISTAEDDNIICISKMLDLRSRAFIEKGIKLVLLCKLFKNLVNTHF